MPKPRRVAVMLDLDWPYKRHTGVFAGAQQYAQERGWYSIIDEYVDDTLARGRRTSPPYDGVIARATTKLAVLAKRLKVPVVNVWFSSPASKLLPGVFPDYRAIGSMRAEHLLSRGFRRFAALTSWQHGHNIELDGFCETLGAAGYPVAVGKLPLHANSLRNWRKMEQAITASMEKWILPIGVYAGAERDGRLLAQMCRNRGWSVPGDVAIIAGNNEETFCEGLRPTLSSVEFGYERIGYEAAKLLERLMDGEAPPKEPKLLQPVGIVARESTDFLAVEDELIAEALRFIAEKCHKPMGPDDVARAVSTEKRTLQRRFEKYLNRPIASEIRRVRIERAKRELTQSERSLSEIARDVGFGEAMRMYEIFRRELGVTPSQYRRERRVDMRAAEDMK